MSFVWLLTEIYLVGSFISAVMVFCACVMSARLADQEMRQTMTTASNYKIGGLKSHLRRSNVLIQAGMKLS